MEDLRPHGGRAAHKGADDVALARVHVDLCIHSVYTYMSYTIL